MTIRNISYIDLYMPNGILSLTNPKLYVIFSKNIKDIKLFLDSLKDNKFYVLEASLPIEDIYDDFPKILLSKPFIVTNSSNPLIIQEHLNSRIKIVNEKLLHLDDDFLDECNLDDGCAVIINYKEINLDLYINFV